MTTTTHTTNREVFQWHFARMWPERHDTTPMTLVGLTHMTRGEVTRDSLRQNLRAQRAQAARGE